MKKVEKEDVSVNKEKLKNISKSTDNEKLKASIDQKLNHVDKPIIK